VAQITIGTFNVENLFTRFRFRKPKDATGPETSPTGIIANTGPSMVSDAKTEALKAALMGPDGVTLDRKNFERVLEEERKLTAQALKALKADFMGLQEVENLDTLRLFNTHNLKGVGKFDYQIVIDGNDPRFIDVGVLSNFEVTPIRTHQFRRKSNRKVFSRDCLEVELMVGNKKLAVFVNHLKSMLGGREQTKPKRAQQSREIIEILEERFGPNYGQADFVVLGDMNDYMEAGHESQSGIRALLQSGQMENVIERLPAAERWTHYYTGDKSYNQLDYILVSKALAQRNPNALPVIERRGQSTRVNQPNQPPRVPKFFKGVTRTKKASDHCPVAITLEV